MDNFYYKYSWFHEKHFKFLQYLLRLVMGNTSLVLVLETLKEQYRTVGNFTRTEKLLVGTFQIKGRTRFRKKSEMRVREPTTTA